ncbi:hypothetical protein VNI00_015459 [Paramarasmius palmivorus]|uniref:Uncharacterized protein n=1 Tax=Paramarasmius palmivorus TaxID=297713 RepID=A0AAW0BKZ5_9AGAR
MSTINVPNSTKTPAKSPLKPEPGSGVSGRHKPSRYKFVYRSILWVSVGLIALGSNDISHASKTLVVTTVNSAAHTSLYQNQSWDEAVATGNRYTVARPLIDLEQKFDVGVTVWLRRAEEETQDAKGAVAKTAIYQDIVFRGLQLWDKARLAKIPLQIPPRIFRSGNISTSDLHASITLVPQSPSILDRMWSFSSWSPTSQKSARSRLGSPVEFGTSETSLLDRVVDSYAVTINLVRLYQKTPSNEVVVSEEDGLLLPENNVPEGSEASCYAFADSGQVMPAERRHMLKPYIISKSHVLVADETHLFDLKGLMEMRELHSRYSGVCEIAPEICDKMRNYWTNGPSETLLQLAADSSDDEPGTGGKKEPEWAYAPYLTGSRRASGPKAGIRSIHVAINADDLVPIPVTRQVCDRNASNAASRLIAERDEDQPINVIWHLTFSTASPRKIVAAELYGSHSTKDASPDHSEVVQLNDQRMLDMMDAFMGDSPDGHPRRKYIVGLLIWLPVFPQIILSILYWVRRVRSSAVYLSIKGTCMIALSYTLIAILNAIQDESPPPDFLETLLFSASMLWAVAPVELVWSELNWMPSSIKVMKPNHRERAVRRLDERFQKRYVLAVYVELTLLYYFISPFNVYLIAPVDPPTTPTSHAWTWAWALINPLYITGRLCQIMLNYRSRVFAGDYKVTVYLWAMSTLCGLISHLEWVMGNDRVKTGWSVGDACYAAMVGILVVQATWLRRDSELGTENEDEK